MGVSHKDGGLIDPRHLPLLAMDPFAIPPKLDDLLAGYDVYGQHGVQWLKPRHNILLDNTSMEWKDDHLFLKGQHATPEGSSRAMYLNRCFPGLPDMTCDDSVLVSCMKPITVQTTTKMLLWNVRDTCWDHNRYDCAWEIDEHTMVLPIKVPSMTKLHILELFAGGYAGWKHASRFLKEVFQVPMQTVGIDASMEACKYYSMSHDAILVDSVSTALPQNIDQWNSDFIVLGDIDDDAWVPAICEWGVHVMSISAPCPPWSGASKGSGLDSDQGSLLPSAILRCRHIRPLVVVLEQVNAFATHRHKNLCMDVLKHVGYQVVAQKVIDSAKFGGVTRIRWLAIAIHRHAEQIRTADFQMWPDIGQFNMEMLDAVFNKMPPEGAELKLTPLMLACAKDTTFLPPMLKKLKNASGDEVLKARTFKAEEVQPTVMSLYGQQHTLCRTTLEQRGYYGNFLEQDSELRLLHPAEIQMAHVTFGEVFYQHDLCKAWVHTGNMISCPHALLMMANAINMIQTGRELLKIDEVFDALFQNRLRVSYCQHIASETASMIVRQGDNKREWMQCLRNFELLQRIDSEFRLPPNHFWKLSDGLLETHELLKMYAIADETSQITEVESKHDDVSMTVPFQAMMKIKVELAEENMSAWIYPNVPPHELIHQFDGQMKLIECEMDTHGFAFTLRHMTQVQSLDEPDGFVMPCLQQGTILFLKLDTKNKVVDQLNELQLEHVMYDQFGILSKGQK